MNIVFMGTPEFAATSLRRLIDSGHNIELVVTQPDKKKNRGKKLVYSPVKEVALENNIPIIQPVRIKNDKEAIEKLRQAHENAEIGIVVAYGQLLPREVLDMPQRGYVNVHASLLPKLRGASPIQTAILLNENPTGISIMKLEEKLDSGPVYSSVNVDVTGKTAGELESDMAEVGAELLAKTLDRFDEIKPQIQNDSDATFCGIIKKQDGHIDFSKGADEIERMCRAYDPWPGTFASIGDKTYKFWKFKLVNSVSSDNVKVKDEDFYFKTNVVPGEIVEVTADRLVIACGIYGEERISVLELQAPGKKRMNIEDFLRGNKISKGMKFV